MKFAENKVPLVLFSGGADSTYLVLHRLIEGPIDTLYIEGNQGEVKTFREKRAISEIMKSPAYLSRNYPIREMIEFQLSPMTAGCEPNGKVTKPLNYYANGLALQQAPVWLFGAMMSVNPERHTSVQISYVMGDSAIGFVHHMEAAWNALWKSCRQGPVVPLEFPLIHTQKSDVFYHLDSDDVYHLTWSCEDYMQDKESRTPCGHCVPCVTARLTRAKMDIRMMSGQPYSLNVVPVKKSEPAGEVNTGDIPKDAPQDSTDEVIEVQTDVTLHPGMRL